MHNSIDSPPPDLFFYSDQVCDVVGGLKVASCKSDYTWKTCTKDLCNSGESDDSKDGSGSSLKPMLFLTALTVTVAMISYS